MGGYNKNSSNIVKYYYNLKQLIYILIYFEMQFKKKSVMARLNSESLLQSQCILTKISVLYLNIFFYVIYSCDQSCIFSIIPPVFSVT